MLTSGGGDNAAHKNKNNNNNNNNINNNNNNNNNTDNNDDDDDTIFILAQLLLTERKIADVDLLLPSAMSLLDSWSPSNQPDQSHLKALVQVFYLVIQVVRYLLDGQVGSGGGTGAGDQDG